MKEYIYEDAYEGLLKLLLLVLPLTTGVFTSYVMNSQQSIPLSLVISIVNLIVSNRNIYKDQQYMGNNRVKIEMMLSMLFLASALVLTAYVGNRDYIDVVQGVAKSIDDNTKLSCFEGRDRYGVSMWLYVIAALPYLTECLYVFLMKDLNLQAKLHIRNKSICLGNLKIEIENSHSIKKAASNN